VRRKRSYTAMKFSFQVLILCFINFTCSTSQQGITEVEKKQTIIIDVDSFVQDGDEIDEDYNFEAENEAMMKDYDYNSFAELELNMTEILKNLDYDYNTDPDLLIEEILKLSSKVDGADPKTKEAPDTAIHTIDSDEAVIVEDIPEENIEDDAGQYSVYEAQNYYDYDSLQEAKVEVLDSNDLNELYSDSDFDPVENSDDYDYAHTTLLEVESADTEDPETMLVDQIEEEHRVFALLYYLGLFIIALMVACSVVSFCLCLRDRRDPKDNLHCQNTVKKSTLVPTIIKSYARLPVDIRNLKQSNVAYQELYNV